MRIRLYADWLSLAGLTLLIGVFSGAGTGDAFESVPYQRSFKVFKVSNRVQLAIYSQPVHLQFQDRTLSEVLQIISSKTGVSFKYPSDLANHSINITISTLGWKQALKELLDGYNRIEIWGQNLNNTQIILMGYALQVDDSHLVLEDAVDESPDPESSGSKDPANNKPKFSSLPPHITNDPQVVKFLYMNGVELPGSVKAKYGRDMEKLPREKQIMHRLLRNNTKWRQYLKSLGLKHPHMS